MRHAPMRPLVDERLVGTGVSPLDPEAWVQQQAGLQRTREERAKNQFGPDKWAEFERRAPGRRVTPENYQERFALLHQMGYEPSTRSQGFNLFDSAGSTIKDAGKAIVNTAGDIITAPTSALAAITKNIPVVGDVTRIVDNVASGPANLANAIASGARIDRAVVAHIKSELKNIKDVAPYAQMVVSVVPGVGTGVAAAIGAGAALAEGKSIDEIAKAAIRGALPGGSVAAAAYDTALKVAAGGNVAQATLEAARAQLPETARHAFDIGLAVVTGESIQNALANGLVNLGKEQLGVLVSAGSKVIASDPALQSALKSVSPGTFSSILPGGPSEGFNAAIGLLGQAGINEKAVAAARAALPEEARKGFDAALKTQESKIAWLKNVPLQTARDAMAQIRALRPNAPPTLTPVAAPRRAPPAMTPIPAPAAKKPPALTPVATKKPPALVAPPAAAPATAARGLYGPYPQARG